MKVEDALRKIRLLRLVNADNGASDAEAENASSLVRRLMDRFAVKSEETRKPSPSQFRMSWVYWDHMLYDFGLELHHFGKRGSAQIGPDRHQGYGRRIFSGLPQPARTQDAFAEQQPPRCAPPALRNRRLSSGIARQSESSLSRRAMPAIPKGWT
jgi:hypothetical protein